MIIGTVTMYLMGAVASAADAISQQQPSNINTLTYILAAAFAGGLATAAVSLYRTKKLGKAQGDQLIASAVNEAVSAAQIMLGEYRKELAHANQVKTELTEILVKRNETINKLEEDLKKDSSERRIIKQEYEQGIVELAQTRDQYHKCKEYTEDLEIKVKALQAAVTEGQQ